MKYLKLSRFPVKIGLFVGVVLVVVVVRGGGGGGGGGGGLGSKYFS